MHVAGNDTGRLSGPRRTIDGIRPMAILRSRQVVEPLKSSHAHCLQETGFWQVTPTSEHF